MRILLAGPPKTGNVWIENILANVYGLTILRPPCIPSTRDADFEAFCDSGKFSDNSIFHQHFVPTERFFRIAEKNGCHVITAIRDPYDTFVSLYFYIQNFRADFLKAGDPGAAVIDLPLDHPIVLDFLKHGFRANLVRAGEWLATKQSLVVRYEDLHADPVREIARITAEIQPVGLDVIRAGVQASDANVLRKKSESLAKHIRRGAVGDWRNYLTDEHLAIFREYHGDIIERIGYRVVTDDVSRAMLRGILSDIPADSVLLVVSKGDEKLLSVGAQSTWHFPRSADGLYAGYHPADGQEAIAHLEALRGDGAGFLLFPSEAIWWLEYYASFRDHLDSNYTKAFEGAEAVLYDVRKRTRVVADRSVQTGVWS